jgi:hypothetical protein
MSQTITLNLENSIKLLVQYINVAQKNGAYSLQEADTLEKGVGLLNGEPSKSDLENGLNCLIQGVVKGQKHGSYSLSDASILYNIIVFLTTPPNVPSTSVPVPLTQNALAGKVPVTSTQAPKPDPVPVTPTQAPKSEPVTQNALSDKVQVQEDDDDVTFDLSESVPLRPNITRL